MDAPSLRWLLVAAVGATFALGVWFVFLRPVAQHTAEGVITRKVFKPADTYWQQPTGQRTNFWMPTRIPIAECYVFTIRLDSQPVDAVFSLNTTASEGFAVGRRVSINYEERGLGVFWQRVYVLDMRPA
jgi:hypothetical protein